MVNQILHIESNFVGHEQCVNFVQSDTVHLLAVCCEVVVAVVFAASPRAAAPGPVIDLDSSIEAINPSFVAFIRRDMQRVQVRSAFRRQEMLNRAENRIINK